MPRNVHYGVHAFITKTKTLGADTGLLSEMASTFAAYLVSVTARALSSADRAIPATQLSEA